MQHRAAHVNRTVHLALAAETLGGWLVGFSSSRRAKALRGLECLSLKLWFDVFIPVGMWPGAEVEHVLDNDATSAVNALILTSTSPTLRQLSITLPCGLAQYVDR